MPPRGNQKKKKKNTNKWKCHQKSSTKTQETKHKNKKGNSFHQTQKIRRSDFLIKLAETQQFSKPTKNKKKIAARKTFLPGHRYSTKA
jgi:hypothetical protein